MRYSEEFKNNVLSRLMAGEITVAQASEQYGVSTSSLHSWKKKALQATQADSAAAKPETGVKETMSKLRLPKGVSYLKAHEAVSARQLLGEAEFGAYCRKNGLLSSTVAEWARWFQAHPDACDAKELQSERQLRLQAQSESAAKTRELARKDKALSETATMLVLAKKAQAIWGVKEN